MAKKILFTGLVLLGFVFSEAKVCFADAAGLLEQAHTYQNTGWRRQAQQSYETIVTDYPGSSYALKAQAELVILDIPEKQDSQIQAAIEGLIANYTGNPDLPAVLCNIAASFGWSSKYDQATNLYWQVILRWPASSAVAKAELGISRINIVSLIKNGDYSAAAAETDKMLEDFSGQEYLPAALYQIARRYQWSREYELAKNVHQEIIQRFPESSQAERARLDAARIKALSLIKSGDYAAAEAETSKLMQEFSGQLSLAVVVHSIASEYERKGKYEKAASLHQQIIQQWPDHSYVERAEFDFSKTTVLSLIQGGEYSAASAKLDKFIADFGRHQLFTEAMFVVGEQYYQQACAKEGEGQAKQLYQKAITAWSRVTGQSQSYEFTPMAWYFSGHCYRRLGDYEKGIECCEKVVADWPAYQYASDSQFTIGRIYQKLAKKGVIPEEEAEVKIKAAFQELVEKYPDCIMAGYAQDWLNRHSTE